MSTTINENITSRGPTKLTPPNDNCEIIVLIVCKNLLFTWISKTSNIVRDIAWVPTEIVSLKEQLFVVQIMWLDGHHNSVKQKRIAKCESLKYELTVLVFQTLLIASPVKNEVNGAIKQRVIARTASAGTFENTNAPNHNVPFPKCWGAVGGPNMKILPSRSRSHNSSGSYMLWRLLDLFRFQETSIKYSLLSQSFP